MSGALYRLDCYFRFIFIRVLSCFGECIYKKVLFSTILLTSATLGLAMEYVLYLTNKPYSNMSGAIFNTSLIVIGFVLGIIIQILYTRSKTS